MVPAWHKLFIDDNYLRFPLPDDRDDATTLQHMMYCWLVCGRRSLLEIFLFKQLEGIDRVKVRTHFRTCIT